MRNAEAKLAEWHRLYVQLEQARADLARDALAGDPTAQARGRLLARLEEGCDRALDAVHTAISIARKAPQQQKRAPVP